MAGFQASAVVQIYEGQEALGSGYALGNGRVLTARHVVGGRAQVHVRREGEQEGTPMVVAWRGASDAVDVAVLQSVEAEGSAGGPPTVSFFGGDPLGKEWSARGFPAVLRDKAEPVSGKVERAQDANAPSCRFSVEAPPMQPKDWKGMSGSAVFVGDRLFAVLRSVPSKFTGAKLTAVPVARLLDSDETFRVEVGYSDWRTPEDHVPHVTAEIVRRLKLHAGLADGLVVACDAWQQALKSGEEALVQAMLAETSPVVLVSLVQDAMARLKGELTAQTMADAMFGILDCALPVVCGSCNVMRRERDGYWSTPSDHKHANEARMAWRDGRPVEFSSRDLGPKNELPAPRGCREIHWVPVQGMEAAEKVKVIQGDFCARFEALALDYYDAEGGEIGSYERIYEDLNDSMRMQKSDEDPRRPLTFYGIMPNLRGPEEQEKFLSAQRAFLKELAIKLPAFVLLVPQQWQHWSPEDRRLNEALRVLYKTYRAVTGVTR